MSLCSIRQSIINIPSSICPRRHHSLRTINKNRLFTGNVSVIVIFDRHGSIFRYVFFFRNVTVLIIGYSSSISILRNVDFLHNAIFNDGLHRIRTDIAVLQLVLILVAQHLVELLSAALVRNARQLRSRERAVCDRNHRRRDKHIAQLGAADEIALRDGGDAAAEDDSLNLILELLPRRFAGQVGQFAAAADDQQPFGCVKAPREARKSARHHFGTLRHRDHRRHEWLSDAAEGKERGQRRCRETLSFSHRDSSFFLARTDSRSSCHM